MTLYVPLALDDSNIHPNSPPFLVPSPSPGSHLTTVIQAVLKAKRIAVVCGAGISVEAGIPDFRSQDGLFKSMKRDNPKEALSSGKDLFDTSVFKSQEKTALFYRMIARLSSLSSEGRPTAFHQLLRILDDRGQLLRVYTQNIDALEMKAGLSFGVPQFDEKKLRVKLKGKAKAKAKETGSGAYNARLGSGKSKRLHEPTAAPSLSTPPNEVDTPGAGPSTPSRRVTPSFPAPVVPATLLNVIPRCIPLHGTLLTLHCQHCTQSFPLDPPALQAATSISPPSSRDSSASASPLTSLHTLLARGTPPPCPSCTSLEETRALVGKRLRGIGKLRPSVVLYGEEHREGEGVGEVVRRDLCGISDVKVAPASPDKLDPVSPSKSRVRAGKGPDLLLVVGTSLRVPGTKRIVREFSKAVRPSAPSPAPSRPPTPGSVSPPAADKGPEPIRTVYLNFDFPLPAREWEGVFDVWVNGDAQSFAKAVADVIKAEEQTIHEKQRTSTKGSPSTAPKAKTKTKTGTGTGRKNTAPGKVKGKRKVDVPVTPTRPSKRRKVNVEVPPTPDSLPRLARGRSGRTKKAELGETSSHKPKRRVILRLPPPPTPVTSSKPTLKRKRSIPEVVITTTPAMFSRRLARMRSLSPLTSLSSSSSSSLTSLSSISEPMSSSAAIGVWRKGVTPEKLLGPVESELSDEDEEPLSVQLARQSKTRLSPPRNCPPLKHAYSSKANRSGGEHAVSHPIFA